MSAVTHLLSAQAALARLTAADPAQEVVHAVLAFRLAQALAALGHHAPAPPARPATRSRRAANGRSAGVVAQ